jgi:hypothetical protein
VDAIAALFAKGTGDPYLFTRDHSLTLTPPWSPASVAGAGLGRDVITRGHDKIGATAYAKLDES